MSKAGDPGEPLDRCPVPHHARWTDDGRQAADTTAAAHAEASHLDATRAAEMARAVADQRATARGAEEINERFVALIGDKLGYGHPLSRRTGTLEFTWTPEAEARLREVPEFCRELTRWRVEWTAHRRGLGSVITPEAMETKYDMWGEVSHKIEVRGAQQLTWSAAALSRLDRVPEFVRGQVIQAVEGNAIRLGREGVDDDTLDDTIARWSSTGDFHEGRFGFK
ncbi:MAG: PCP reductase family protein [Candidatus Dormibacteria bacterium]